MPRLSEFFQPGKNGNTHEGEREREREVSMCLLQVVLARHCTDSSELMRRQQVNTASTTADIHEINTMSNLQAHTETCDSLLLG